MKAVSKRGYRNKERHRQKFKTEESTAHSLCKHKKSPQKDPRSMSSLIKDARALHSLLFSEKSIFIKQKQLV